MYLQGCNKNKIDYFGESFNSLTTNYDLIMFTKLFIGVLSKRQVLNPSSTSTGKPTLNNFSNHPPYAFANILKGTK